MSAIIHWLPTVIAYIQNLALWCELYILECRQQAEDNLNTQNATGLFKYIGMKKAPWVTFAFLCMVIGLYPLIYIFLDKSFFIENNIGFFARKSQTILNDIFWNIGFFGHIIFGGIALLVGWVQFSKKVRAKNLKLHRTIGKIYIISVLISGVCGLYIAFFATSGIISALGFASLGIIWLTTTSLAFNAIKKGDIDRHEKLMIFSYASCFAAVTLRIWLPILIILLGDFDYAYRVVAWLCWIPNLIIAYFIINKKRSVISNV